MATTIALAAAAAMIVGIRFMTLRLGSPRLGDTADDTAEFVPVPNEAALDDLFAESDANPVILYLHDPGCPVSARAYRRVRDLDARIYFVDVSRQHDLNRAIERRTGVRHESPQAFVLKDRTPQWSASHGAIDPDAIRRTIAHL